MQGRGSGEYFDGTAPLARRVEVTLGREALSVVGPDGAALASWMLREIDFADRRPATLTLTRRGGEARLKVTDPDLAAALLQAIGPGLRRRARLGTLGWIGAGGGLVAALGAFLIFGWPATADLVARLLPELWLDHLGRATATAIVGKQPRCADPRGVTLLESLAGRIAETSGRPRPEITVVRHPVANAFAMPANRVVIFSGLITGAQHPNEIAGVLAHEIGHLERRHPSRQLVRQGGLFLLVELFTGGSSLGGFGASAVSTGYSRAFEREADDFARAALSELGLDARPVAGFFARMAEKEKSATLPFGLGGGFDYLSTHPNSGERAAFFKDAAPGRAALTAAEFAALKGICGAE